MGGLERESFVFSFWSWQNVREALWGKVSQVILSLIVDNHSKNCICTFKEFTEKGAAVKFSMIISCKRFYSVGKWLKEKFDPGLLVRAEGPGLSLAKFELPTFHVEISEKWQCKNSK